MKNEFCLNYDGGKTICNKEICSKGCPVYERGFCEQFIKASKHIIKKLNDQFHPEEEATENKISEIISKIKLEVLRKLDKYEGRNNAQFSTWMSGFYKNILKNYFGKYNKTSRHEIHFNQPTDDETDEPNTIENMFGEEGFSADDIDISILLKKLNDLAKNGSKAARFYLEWYYGMKMGYTEKEIAQRLGMNSSTFRVYLNENRLFEAIKKELRL